MKKYLILPFTIIFLGLAGVVEAQHSIPVSLNLYGGYTFGDRLDLGNYNSYNSYGHINEAGQFGAGLEFYLRPVRSLEISYQYMGTHIPFYNYQGQTNSGSDKASLQYILIGGNNYFPTHSNVLPYGGIGVGVGLATYDYNGQGSSTYTKFAWNLHLGVKIKTESALSIKLQAYLQSIAQGVGVGVGFGTGGAGAGVSTYSSILQFGLGAGLCFAFGGHGDQKSSNQKY
jgi:opacity protein-like surface antigen